MAETEPRKASAPTPLSAEEAQVITSQILASVDGLARLLVRAFQGRVWEPLGYESWNSYCQTELGGTRFDLSTGAGREAIALMRREGMSLRAIASGTGVSKDTVSRSLETADEPEPEAVTSLDGRTRPAQCSGSSGQVVSDDVLDAPAENFGVRPVPVRSSDSDSVAARLGALASSSLSQVVSRAGQIAITDERLIICPDVERDREEGARFVCMSARSMNVLASLLSSVEDLDALVDQEQWTQVRANLQDSADRLGEVLDRP